MFVGAGGGARQEQMCQDKAPRWRCQVLGPVAKKCHWESHAQGTRQDVQRRNLTNYFFSISSSIKSLSIVSYIMNDNFVQIDLPSPSETFPK